MISLGFPNIPNVTPAISITLGQTIPLLLTSVAFEELALAHIMNAEAEKLQYFLGTLTPGQPSPPVTISDIRNVNKGVRKTLKSVIHKEMLLQFKLENIIDLVKTQS